MDAKIVREPSRDELALMINAAFRTSGYTLDRLKGGIFNTSYLLRIGTKKYVLRCGPVNRGLLLPYELRLMDGENRAYELLKRANIPTSTVVYIDSSKRLLDRDFMIVEYIESLPLPDAPLSDEQKREVYREAGELCARMSKIEGEKFGRLGDIVNGGGYASWSEYLKNELSEWAESVRRNTSGYYTESELGDITALPTLYAEVLDDIKSPRFNHCDMWALNILLKTDGSNKIAAIIDPDRACFGDPDLELSSGWMMNDAFYEGYGRHMAGDERTTVRTNIYKMLFLLLNGYFMRTQYDDPAPSMSDKARVMEYLKRLL